MALTQEQINSYRQQYGISAPSDSSAPTAPVNKVTGDALIQQLKSSIAPAQPSRSLPQGVNPGTGFKTSFPVTGDESRIGLIGKGVGNIPKSGLELGKNIVSAVVRPKRTIKSIGGLVKGLGAQVAEEFTENTKVGNKFLNFAQDYRAKNNLPPLPTNDEGQIQGARIPEQQLTDELGGFVNARYGDPDSAVKSLVEDPVGVLADVASLATGVGASVKVAGNASRVGELANVGSKISKFGSAIEPLNIAGKGLGFAKSRFLPKKAPVGVVDDIASFSPEDATRIAGERGIELPASAKTNNPIASQVEALAAKGLFGGKVRDRITKAISDITRVADETLKKLNATDDPALVGQEVLDSLNNTRDNFATIKDDLYAPINGISETKAVTSSTTLALGDIISSKTNILGDGAGINKFQKMLTDITTSDIDFTVDAKGNITIPKNITFETLKNTRTEIGAALKSGDSLVNQNQAQLKKLYAALSDDLDATAVSISPEMGKALEEANTFYKENLSKISDKFIQKIVKQSENPSKIGTILTQKSTSIEDIGRLFELIDEGAVDAVRAEVMKQIIDGGKNDKTGMLTASAIDKGVNKIGRAKLESILDQSQMKTLDDLDVLTNSMAEGASLVGGSQTAFLGRMFGEFVLGAAFNLPVAIKVIALDAALSSFFGTKLGQRILTSGVASPLFKRLKSAVNSDALNNRLVSELTTFLKENPNALFQAGRLDNVTNNN